MGVRRLRISGCLKVTRKLVFEGYAKAGVLRLKASWHHEIQLNCGVVYSAYWIMRHWVVTYSLKPRCDRSLGGNKKLTGAFVLRGGDAS